MNKFSYISIYYGSQVDDVGRANDKACHNELDQSKLSTKQKQYSNKRQTSIEVKVGKLLSVFFISIFAGQLQQRFESHGNRYLVLLNSRHLKTP